jgi:hypothetical protein
MKLLRTIRLDPSDRLVFERAAEPGEWAVAGGFMFADGDPAALEGKARMAFRSGILGIESFGWSTLAAVAEIDDAERDAIVETLARRFVEQLGAPDLAAARAAAAEEIADTAELAQHPVNTLVASGSSVPRAWSSAFARCTSAPAPRAPTARPSAS